MRLLGAFRNRLFSVKRGSILRISQELVEIYPVFSVPKLDPRVRACVHAYALHLAYLSEACRNLSCPHGAQNTICVCAASHLSSRGEGASKKFRIRQS